MVYIERVRSFTIPIRSIGYVKELTMNVVAKSARDHRARRAVKRFGYVARKSRQFKNSGYNLGGFQIIDPSTKYVVDGPYFELTANDVLTWCADADRVAAMTKWALALS